MKENYEILGISENATDEEVETAYKTLKEKYSRDRFLEGEEGNAAARMLTKVETAYSEIVADRKLHGNKENSSREDFSEIENAIKAGKLSEAQTKLDNVYDRSAEWHYLQSVVFYKKNWINESKKQLEIAMNMDPHNEKYADSYTKLKQKMEFNEKQFHSGNVQYSADGTYRESQRQMGGSGANDCLSLCATWCCFEMMCNICCSR